MVQRFCIMMHSSKSCSKRWNRLIGHYLHHKTTWARFRSHVSWIWKLSCEEGELKAKGELVGLLWLGLDQSKLSAHSATCGSATAYRWNPEEPVRKARWCLPPLDLCTRVEDLHCCFLQEHRRVNALTFLVPVIVFGLPQHAEPDSCICLRRHLYVTSSLFSCISHPASCPPSQWIWLYSSCSCI